MAIKVTTGPGAKSGIIKVSVAAEGERIGWPTRHYTNPDRAEARVSELQRLLPSAQVVRVGR